MNSASAEAVTSSWHEPTHISFLRSNEIRKKYGALIEGEYIISSSGEAKQDIFLFIRMPGGDCTSKPRHCYFERILESQVLDSFPFSP